MDDFVSGFLPGISFVSVGKLNFHMNLTQNGAVTAMDISGVMCIGPETECDKGVPSDRNIVTQVRLKRVDCAGGLVVFAKISKVDLKRVLSIISSGYAHLYRLVH